MKSHIIVCGLGTIGFRTFELLQQLGEEVTVITASAPIDWKNKVEGSNSAYLEGDARDESILIRAEIEQAKAIIAVTSSDLVNLSIAMDARKINQNIKIIVRLFDTELAEHITETLRIERIFSTSALAAPVFASSALGRNVIGVLHFPEQSFSVLEMTAKHCADSTSGVLPFLRFRDGKIGEIRDFKDLNESDVILALQTIEDEKIEETELFDQHSLFHIFSKLPKSIRKLIPLLLITVFSSSLLIKLFMGLSYLDAIYLSIATITTVGYGDFNFSQAPPAMKVFGCFLMISGAAIMALIFSVATDLLLTEKFKAVFGGNKLPKKDHTIIIGSGHIGMRVIEYLRVLRAQAVVIECDKSDKYTGDLRRIVSIVEGDPRSEDTLMRAGIKTAKSIIAITEDDIENLGIGLLAKKLNPLIHASIRTFDLALGMKLQRQLKIDRVSSVSATTAPYFAGAALDPSIHLALKWNGHLFLISSISQKADYRMDESKVQRFAYDLPRPNGDTRSKVTNLDIEILPLNTT